MSLEKDVTQIKILADRFISLEHSKLGAWKINEDGVVIECVPPIIDRSLIREDYDLYYGLSPEASKLLEKKLLEDTPLFKAASPENLKQREIEAAKKYSTDKILTIKAQYPIDVSFLIKKMFHKEWDEVEDYDVDAMLESILVIKLISKEVKKEIAGRPIEILDVELSEVDSGNWSHAMAYYYVELRGPEIALHEIANEEGAQIFYSWDIDNTPNGEVVQ